MHVNSPDFILFVPPRALQDREEKSLMEIIRSRDVYALDRYLQARWRRPGGAGEDMRQGNLIEQLVKQRGVSMSEAFKIAREKRPELGGKTYLELCHTHEGWIEAREALGLGRPADA